MELQRKTELEARAREEKGRGKGRWGARWRGLGSCSRGAAPCQSICYVID
jgi:hypothetical protein